MKRDGENWPQCVTTVKRCAAQKKIATYIPLSYHMVFAVLFVHYIYYWTIVSFVADSELIIFILQFLIHISKLISSYCSNLVTKIDVEWIFPQKQLTFAAICWIQIVFANKFYSKFSNTIGQDIFTKKIIIFIIFLQIPNWTSNFFSWLRAAINVSSLLFSSDMCSTHCVE